MKKEIIIALVCASLMLITPLTLGTNVKVSHNYNNLPLTLDKASGDLFGYSVSIDGCTALIGAQNDDDNGVDSGAAYIFNHLGPVWSGKAKLLSSDGAKGDRFGVSVSIDGNYALVGADLNDDNGQYTGSAYIFKRVGLNWSEQQKLIGSDSGFYDFFGGSVCIDGKYAFIGAPGDSDPISESGSAYVFKRDGTTWTEQQKIFASDVKVADYFGTSISIDGEYALIGAPNDWLWGNTPGAAYVFKRDGTTWTEQAKLIPSDGASKDSFGLSVSLDGDYALIGSPGDGDNGQYSGSAYVFKRNGTTWSEQVKIIPSDGAKDEIFGASVSINRNTALIGAPEIWGNTPGAAYVFKRDGTTWTEQAKLIPSDGATGDNFGIVSLNGNTALIGAPYHQVNGEDSGSVYIFKRVGPIWLNQDSLIPQNRAAHHSLLYRYIDMFPILQKILNYIL